MTLDLDRRTWKRVAFGDVVKNLNVTVKDPEAEGINRVIAMEHLDPGELKVNHWGDVAHGTTFTRRVRPGQTLFGKRRAYQRKAAYAEFDAICSGDILVFGPDHHQMLPEFLPFLVQSNGFYDHALGTSAGSLSPRTNWRDLANYEFDLPPLDEQKRIADLLWAVGRASQSLATLRATTTTARRTWLDGQVDSILDHDVVPFEQVWRQSPESGWSAAVDERTGRFVLSLAALGSNGYRPGQLKNVPDTPEVRGAVLAQGDLLISRANTVDTVGRVGIFSEDRSDVSFPDTMMRLRLIPSVLPEFAEAVLSSNHGRKHMRRTAAGSATSMVKINRVSLARFSFPRVPVESQRVLLERAAVFDRALTTSDAQSFQLLAVKSAISRAIFGGVA